MSAITELKMRRFGSYQMCWVTYVLIQFCGGPGLIFLQYFKPNEYFQAISISDWTDLCTIYLMSFVHMNSN